MRNEAHHNIIKEKIPLRCKIWSSPWENTGARTNVDLCESWHSFDSYTSMYTAGNCFQELEKGESLFSPPASRVLFLLKILTPADLPLWKNQRNTQAVFYYSSDSTAPYSQVQIFWNMWYFYSMQNSLNLFHQFGEHQVPKISPFLQC